MRKGKFGVVLCLYPIVGFACVILNQPLLCAAVFALALIAERDPWAGRQTLQAFALSAVTAVLRSVLAFVVQLFPGDYYSWGGAALSVRCIGRPLRPGVPAGHCHQRAGHHPGDERPGGRPAPALRPGLLGLWPAQATPRARTVHASPFPTARPWAACPSAPSAGARGPRPLSALCPAKSPCAAPAWEQSPGWRSTQGVNAPFSS